MSMSRYIRLAPVPVVSIAVSSRTLTAVLSGVTFQLLAAPADLSCSELLWGLR
jgi:hypothetical protein